MHIIEIINMASHELDHIYLQNLNNESDNYFNKHDVVMDTQTFDTNIKVVNKTDKSWGEYGSNGVLGIVWW